MSTCEMETQAGARESPEIMSGPIEGIPLYLIPKTIAEQIKVKREQVFMITVERGLHHCYTINVETFDEYTARVNRAG
ncbi:MAG: hypothetical protein WC626_10865 [Methanoregula sp.]